MSEIHNGYKVKQAEDVNNVDFEKPDLVDTAWELFKEAVSKIERCLWTGRCAKGVDLTILTEYPSVPLNEELHELIKSRYGVYTVVGKGIWVRRVMARYGQIMAEYEVYEFNKRILNVVLIAIYT